jgi:hypothetical protein
MIRWLLRDGLVPGVAAGAAFGVALFVLSQLANPAAPSKWLTNVVVPLLSPLSAFLVAWFAGHRLSTEWSLRQKRRESAMVLAAQFFSLYGKFFGLWKEWNRTFPGTSERCAELYARASENEGELEALLVSLAAQRTLGSEEQEILGTFRQLYQTVRNSIKKPSKVPWESSDDENYVRFKTYAVKVAHLIMSPRTLDEPELSGAQFALLEVTSNRWEVVHRSSGPSAQRSS